jgi:hypothetical protein
MGGRLTVNVFWSHTSNVMLPAGVLLLLRGMVATKSLFLCSQRQDTATGTTHKSGLHAMPYDTVTHVC